MLLGVHPGLSSGSQHTACSPQFRLERRPTNPIGHEIDIRWTGLISRLLTVPEETFDNRRVGRQGWGWGCMALFITSGFWRIKLDTIATWLMVNIKVFVV